MWNNIKTWLGKFGKILITIITLGGLVGIVAKIILSKYSDTSPKDEKHEYSGGESNTTYEKSDDLKKLNKEADDAIDTFDRHFGNG